MIKRLLLFIAIFTYAVVLMGCDRSTPAPQPAESTQQETAPQPDVQSTPAQPETRAVAEPTQPEAAAPAVELDGKALVSERCTDCHGMAKIEGVRFSADGWKNTVERMIGKGAKLTDVEKQAVIDYLVKTYGE